VSQHVGAKTIDFYEDCGKQAPRALVVFQLLFAIYVYGHVAQQQIGQQVCELVVLLPCGLDVVFEPFLELQMPSA
jgi:uncharacterized protein YqhQ